MPFICTKPPTFRHLLDDALLDSLQRMGQHGRNENAPSAIRAAFTEAHRRGLITQVEAMEGASICLRLPMVTMRGSELRNA